MRHASKKQLIQLWSWFSPVLKFIIPAFIVISPGIQVQGATLKARTAEAYQQYMEKVELEMAARRQGTLPYLMVSESPGNMVSLSQDLIVIRNLYENDETPKGIIHDWLGAVFFKGISMDQALNILMDIRRHPAIFKEVLDCEVLNQSEDSVTARIVYRIDGILTVVTDSQQESEIIRISENKAQIICRSSRINEISNYGKENEKILPEGNDRGLIWRLDSYITLEENEEGVTLECRFIQLSRDIPFGISLFLGPHLKKMLPESIESMLTGLRSYLYENRTLVTGHEMAN